MRQRRRQIHYTVFVLADGTVMSVLPGRKVGRDRPDPDGVVLEHPEQLKGLKGHADWYVGMIHTILATRLNVRRSIRELVEPRLERIESQLAAIQETLQAGAGAGGPIRAEPSR